MAAICSTSSMQQVGSLECQDKVMLSYSTERLER